MLVCMIGCIIWKVILYVVWCKKCILCVKDDNNNDYDCRRNWDKFFKSNGVRYGYRNVLWLKVKDFYVNNINIIMDNDVIIILRVKVIFDLFF